MEVIKKRVLQAVTTGSTSGGTVIIPDLTKDYYFKFLLTQDSHDIGFFDAVETEETVVYIFVDSNDDVFTDSNNDIFIM